MVKLLQHLEWLCQKGSGKSQHISSCLQDSWEVRLHPMASCATCVQHATGHEHGQQLPYSLVEEMPGQSDGRGGTIIILQRPRGVHSALTANGQAAHGHGTDTPEAKLSTPQSGSHPCTLMWHVSAILQNLQNYGPAKQLETCVRTNKLAQEVLQCWPRKLSSAASTIDLA